MYGCLCVQIAEISSPSSFFFRPIKEPLAVTLANEMSRQLLRSDTMYMALLSWQGLPWILDSLDGRMHIIKLRLHAATGEFFAQTARASRRVGSRSLWVRL